MPSESAESLASTGFRNSSPSLRVDANSAVCGWKTGNPKSANATQWKVPVPGSAVSLTMSSRCLGTRRMDGPIQTEISIPFALPALRMIIDPTLNPFFVRPS